MPAGSKHNSREKVDTQTDTAALYDDPILASFTTTVKYSKKNELRE